MRRKFDLQAERIVDSWGKEGWPDSWEGRFNKGLWNLLEKRISSALERVDRAARQEASDHTRRHYYYPSDALGWEGK